MRSSSKLQTPIGPSRVAASRAVFIGCAHSPIHQAIPLRDHDVARSLWRGVAREGAPGRGAGVPHAPHYPPHDPPAPAQLRGDGGAPCDDPAPPPGPPPLLTPTGTPLPFAG